MICDGTKFSAVVAFIVSAVLSLAPLGGVAQAGEADVVGVTATQNGDGSWRFDVTVAHADTGWDHYADRWDVVAPDGTVLGSRVLLHPHVNEQPFTRSLNNIDIAKDIEVVTVRAHDSVHGLGGEEMRVTLPR
ncbi:MAG: hypothetical protein AAF940_14575 [Pseudomonadota bacterium]